MEAKHISDEIAADDNGISASANPGNNAALTIGGALHSGNTVTNTGGRYTFGGDGILFDKGMYVTYTIGHIDMMNFFFN